MAAWPLSRYPPEGTTGTRETRWSAIGFSRTQEGQGCGPWPFKHRAHLMGAPITDGRSNCSRAADEKSQAREAWLREVAVVVDALASFEPSRRLS